MAHTARRLLHKVIDAPLKFFKSLFPGDVYIILLWAAFAGVSGAIATQVFREGIQGLQWLLDWRSVSVVEMAESLPWYFRVGSVL